MNITLFNRIKISVDVDTSNVGNIVSVFIHSVEKLILCFVVLYYDGRYSIIFYKICQINKRFILAIKQATISKLPGTLVLIFKMTLH